MVGSIKSIENVPNIIEDYEQCNVHEWTNLYFTFLLKELDEQMIWLQHVFQAESHIAAENLMEMLLDVFKNLDPSLNFCFQAGLKLQSDPLDHLTNIKVSFNQFVQKLDQEFFSNSKLQSHQRLQTKMRELSMVIYGPFKSNLNNYQTMAAAKLLQELESNTTTSKDILDELRLISLSVPKLVSSFKKSSEQCLLLTEGCTFSLMVNALEECLVQYLERFIHLMRRLEKRKNAAHSWNILQQSLTLNQTCGDLLMNLEELDISIAIGFLDKAKPFMNSNEKAIFQHHLYLLENSSLKKLQEFHSRVKQNPTVLSPLFKHIQSTCEDLQNCTFKILFHPIKEQLNQVSSQTMLEQVWTSSSAGAGTREPDMPDFSFSPQEYITQIGQYLMTMPQHLEPYMTNDNPALSRALQERVFPFCSSVSSRTKEFESSNTPADFLLSCIARATCQTYQDHILKIPSLSLNSTKQLYTDIGYIGDILEDLGHPLTDSLSSINRLLKLTPKELSSSEEPQKWIQVVTTMRNL